MDLLEGSGTLFDPCLDVLTKPGKVGGERVLPCQETAGTRAKVGAGGIWGCQVPVPLMEKRSCQLINRDLVAKECRWLLELSFRDGPKASLIKSRAAMHRRAENVLAIAGMERAWGEVCGDRT